MRSLCGIATAARPRTATHDYAASCRGLRTGRVFHPAQRPVERHLPSLYYVCLSHLCPTVRDFCSMLIGRTLPPSTVLSLGICSHVVQPSPAWYSSLLITKYCTSVLNALISTCSSCLLIARSRHINLIYWTLFKKKLSLSFFLFHIL